MANIFGRITNKLGHIGTQAFNSATNWGGTGVLAGALYGGALALLTPVAWPAIITYGVAFGFAGGGLGAAVGAVKGLITRARSNRSDNVEAVTPATLDQLQSSPLVEEPQQQPAQSASPDALDEVRALAEKLGGLQVSEAKDGQPEMKREAHMRAQKPEPVAEMARG